jgi:DHA1 family arabinose polymer transporter-like MFS transporter
MAFDAWNYQYIGINHFAAIYAWMPKIEASKGNNIFSQLNFFNKKIPGY